MEHLRVVLFPGHHGPGTGATSDGYDEWQIVSNLTNVVGAHLVAKDWNVCQATGGGGSYITRRAEYATDACPDVAISIHLNANAGRPGTGTEVWYLKAPPGTPEPTSSGKLATLLSGYVSNQLNLRDRGPKPYTWLLDGEGRRIRLLELMNEICPCVLLEVCFLNNPADRAKLLEEPFGMEEVALGIGHALEDWVRTRRET